MTTTKDLFNKLENNNFKISNYIYPNNLGSEEFIHAVLFSIYERVDSSTSFSNSNRRIGNLEISNQARAFRTNNPVYDTKKYLVGSTRRLSDTIALCMPSSLSSKYSIKYNNTDVTQSIGFGSAAGRSLTSLKNYYLNGSEESLSSNLKNLINDLKEQKNNNTTDFLKQLVYKPESIYTALSLYSRIAKNPHMEYIFDSVDNRTFNFTFNLTPKNENETRNIDNIIRLFKKASHPKINEMSGLLGVYYDYPCVFDITFISNGQENQWVHKISTCVLNDVDIDYNDENEGGIFYAFNNLDNKGTPPNKISLKLQFEEIEILSRQRIEEGY